MQDDILLIRAATPLIVPAVFPAPSYACRLVRSTPFSLRKVSILSARVRPETPAITLYKRDIFMNLVTFIHIFQNNT